MRFGFMFAAQWIAVEAENRQRPGKLTLQACLPVSIAVTSMTVLGLELGGDGSVVAGRARHNEQSCNDLITEREQMSGFSCKLKFTRNIVCFIGRLNTVVCEIQF